MFHRHTKAGTICRPVSGGMIPPMASTEAVAANRYDHSFLSGTVLHALRVYFIYIADLIRLEF